MSETEAFTPRTTATPVVPCVHCGQKNRIDPGRGAAAICGACKQSVYATQPVTVTDATWRNEVELSALPVLVDFWAPWCGPCRAIAPVIDKIAAERAGKLKVVKVNVDDNPQTAGRFGIQAIPTMMVYKGGNIVDQIRGALPKPALDARLDRTIG